MVARQLIPARVEARNLTRSSRNRSLLPSCLCLCLPVCLCLCLCLCLCSCNPSADEAADQTADVTAPAATPAETEAKAPPRAQLRLTTLDGAAAHPACLSLNAQPQQPDADAPRLAAYIFTHTDCPVANRYAPELARIHAEYAPRGVQFYLVYVDPALTADEIRTHMTEWGYSMGVVRDSYHDLVAVAGALRTPEVAVFAPGRRLLYCGRIDNLYEDYGKARAEASQRDVRNALDAALAGKPIETSRTVAVGCYIADIETAEGRP